MIVDLSPLCSALLLGKMHGPEATRIIREQCAFGGLILGVTGNALPEDIDTFKVCGADDVFIKPFKIKSLLDILSAAGMSMG